MRELKTQCKPGYGASGKAFSLVSYIRTSWIDRPTPIDTPRHRQARGLCGKVICVSALIVMSTSRAGILPLPFDTPS